MLVNVPMIDQRNEPTMDGAPDENASANCVPGSLAAILEALTGRTYDAARRCGGPLAAAVTPRDRVRVLTPAVCPPDP
jgi:hypothetical protein